jgi:hypothetical protein
VDVRLHDTLNPAMTWPPKIRGWKAITLLAAILAVVLLLLPHATDHHATTALFLLVPLFLFAALVEEPRTYQPRTDHIVAPNHHVRLTLFQRPPPSLA